MDKNISPQVQALHQKYRESLIEKLEIASQWYESAKADGLTVDELGALAEWTHRLAGSAGMYEFSTLSSLARKVLERTESITLELGEKIELDSAYQLELKLEIFNLVGELQKLSLK